MFANFLLLAGQVMYMIIISVSLKKLPDLTGNKVVKRFRPAGQKTKTMNKLVLLLADKDTLIIFANSKKRPYVTEGKAYWYKIVLLTELCVSISFLSNSDFLLLSLACTRTCPHSRTHTQSMYLLQHSREDRLEPSPDLTVLLICSSLISLGETECCSRREWRESCLKLPLVEQNISEIYLTISLARWLP